MTFTGPKEFRQAVSNYAIADKKDIKFAKNEPTRVRAKCKWPRCP
jgi:MuDR family transposase